MELNPGFPAMRVGAPIRHEALTVFPLFDGGAAKEEVDYLLSDEAVATGTVVVEEVSESGSVPTLLVTNKGKRKVLFLEGEELRGAKQNRVLNTSVLVGAGKKTTIPVSCVEQGRWRFRSRQFAPSGTSSSSKLRKRLKETVSMSLRLGQGHRSDQGSVWSEVTRQMSSLGSTSETMAMADTYDTFRARIEEFRKHLGYPTGASGLAVAIGPEVVALDVFDKPATCQKVWDRLLTGFVMDALEAKPEAKAIDKVPIAVMGHISINFVVKSAYSSAPILISVGAVLLMHERAPRGTWASLVVSFGGVLLIVRPGFVIGRMTEGMSAAPFSSTPTQVADAAARALRTGSGTVWVPWVLKPLFLGMRLVPRFIWRRMPR